MTEPQRIRQVQRGYMREFVFGEEKLGCTNRDRSGERQYSLPYEAINVIAPSTLVLNKTPMLGWFGLTGFLMIPAALTAASLQLPASFIVGLYLGFGLIWAAVIANQWTRWFSVKFTVLQIAPPQPGANPTLTVLHDRRHDAVMSLLREKWKARVKTLYGRANPRADREQETARLKRLRDHEILDEAEYETEIARLDVAEIQPSLPERMIN